MNAINVIPARPLSVLFVCHDNSRYSLVCEALVRSRQIDGLRAFSAGLDPADRADPYTLSALELAGIGSDGLWPKHWDGFAEPPRKLIDVVVVIGNKISRQLPRCFPGEPEFFVWELGGKDQVRLNGGVRHDIQVLRPYVDALIAGLEVQRRSVQQTVALAAE